MMINMRNIYTTFQDRLLQKSFSVFFNRYVALKKDNFTIFYNISDLRRCR